MRWEEGGKQRERTDGVSSAENSKKTEKDWIPSGNREKRLQKQISFRGKIKFFLPPCPIYGHGVLIVDLPKKTPHPPFRHRMEFRGRRILIRARVNYPPPPEKMRFPCNFFFQHEEKHILNGAARKVSVSERLFVGGKRVRARAKKKEYRRR